MRRNLSCFGAVAVALALSGPLSAQNWRPVPVPCIPCPTPSWMPAQPGMPGTPGTPSTPGASGMPGTTPSPGTPTAPGETPTPGDPGSQPPGTDAQTPPQQPTEPTQAPDLNQPFAQAGEAGVQPRASFNPTVLGDLIATLPSGQRVNIDAGQLLQVPAGTVFDAPVTIRSQSLPGGLPPGTVVPAGVPVPTTVIVTAVDTATTVLEEGVRVNVFRGAYKIGENESPRPLDRVYFNYKYYYNVNSSIIPDGLPRLDINQYVFGFEKTFLGGDASVGLRVPYLQLVTDDPFEADTFGDMSVVLKFALINEPSQFVAGDFLGGDVLSAGLVVTAPTGGRAAFSSRVPEIHPTVIQPWVGGIRSFGRWYAQGFSSIAVPTDNRDTTFLFNSIQLGNFLYVDPTQSRLITAVVPVGEVHVNTPLNNRGARRMPVGNSDVVNLNFGVIFGLGTRSVLNLGVSTPVTGPRPNDVEAILQFNFLF